MLLAHYYAIPVLVSQGVLVLILAVSSAASILYSRGLRPEGELRKVDS
jgi:hypothetical protein